MIKHKLAILAGNLEEANRYRAKHKLWQAGVFYARDADSLMGLDQDYYVKLDHFERHPEHQNIWLLTRVMRLQPITESMIPYFQAEVLDRGYD